MVIPFGNAVGPSATVDANLFYIRPMEGFCEDVTIDVVNVSDAHFLLRC